LFGVIDTTVAFLPLIRKSQGRIVNVASMAGRYSFATMSSYTISKYGVEAFSDALRNEMKHLGVSVHIVEPGYFRTSLTCVGKRKTWLDLDKEIIDEYGQEYFKKALYVYTDSKRGAVDNPEELGAVVNAYEHALFGRFPRARYVVGWDAKVALKFLNWLPEWLADWLAYKIFFRSIDS
jgi:short-subunit dehydrogenase